MDINFNIYLLLFAFIFFLPMILLFFKFFLGFIFSWLFPGPDRLNSIFFSKKYEHDWEINQRSLTALAGRINFVFNMDEADLETGTHSFMFELRAILGKIKIVVPEEFDVMIENKGLLGKIKIFGRQQGGFFFNNTIEKKAEKIDPEANLSLLFSGRCIFGKIEITREEDLDIETGTVDQKTLTS